MKGSQSMIIDASNRFYTLIPHNFGLKKPDILDDPRLIKVDKNFDKLKQMPQLFSNNILIFI